MRVRLAAALDAAGQRIGAFQLDTAEFCRLARELAKTYQRLREDSPKNWRAAEPDVLHDLRRWVVAHRYQMELIEPLWPKFGKLWVAEAQRLRDRLGAFQDLSVLQGFTVPHAAARAVALAPHSADPRAAGNAREGRAAHRGPAPRRAAESVSPPARNIVEAGLRRVVYSG